MEIKHGIIKWKILCYIIGTIGIGINLMFLHSFEEESFNTYKIIVFAINLVASIIWICGVASNRTIFMLPLILWWTLALVIWLINVVTYAVIRMVQTSDETKHNEEEVWKVIFMILDVGFIIGTVIFFIIYILTVLCYKKLKNAIARSRSEIPRLNIAYVEAPTKNEIYPNLH